MTRNEAIEAIEQKKPVAPYIDDGEAGLIMGWADADHVWVKWESGETQSLHFEELSFRNVVQP